MQHTRPKGINDFRGTCDDRRGVCLLGNGPSLTRWEPESLHGAGWDTIGMNSSWTQGPSTWYCFQSGEYWGHFSDGKILTGAVFHLTDGMPRRNPHHIPCYRIHRLRNGQDTPRYDLARGSGSTFAGFLALQLACFLGYPRIYLLGYDCHNNEGHHDDLQRGKCNRKGMVRALEAVAPFLADFGIYNADGASAIKCFPFKIPECEG